MRSSACLPAHFVKLIFAGTTQVEQTLITKDNWRRIFKNQLQQHPWLFAFNCTAYSLAGVGAVFLGVLLAVKMRWTNVEGEIDQFDPEFNATQIMLNNYQTQVLGATTESARLETNGTILSDEQELQQIYAQAAAQKEKIALQQQNLCALKILNKFYPVNVKNILQQYQQTANTGLVTKMITALKSSLTINQDNWQAELDTCLDNFNAQMLNEEILLDQAQTAAQNQAQSAFIWQDQEQWPVLQEAIAKDAEKIQQAAAITGVDARLITSCLIGEQVRLFNSQRELFKQFFSPMKILANSNTISLGTMGIKPSTASEIEAHLKDKNSPYYLGEEYEHLLDFKTSDVGNERYARLTDKNNQFYSYLYAGLYLKQFITQWRAAGFPIDDRPEILVTLYNVGFPQSEPNATPKVGGSKINLFNQTYSFGRLGYEFYYSGALTNLFPLN
ncbi:MAG: hypothetical protein Q4G02_00780 [bacterium]|nr:hypothetical protein [bacterium]